MSFKSCFSYISSDFPKSYQRGWGWYANSFKSQRLSRGGISEFFQVPELGSILSHFPHIIFHVLIATFLFWITFVVPPSYPEPIFRPEVQNVRFSDLLGFFIPLFWPEKYLTRSEEWSAKIDLCDCMLSRWPWARKPHTSWFSHFTLQGSIILFWTTPPYN